MKIFSYCSALSFLVLASCQSLNAPSATSPDAENIVWSSTNETASAKTSTPEKSTKRYAAKAPHIVEMVEPVWNRIQKSGKVVVGVKADAPPFSVLVNGEFIGFEVDLAKAMVASMGLKAEFVPVSAKERTPLLLNDKSDLVMATMTLTGNREEILDFSIPYFEVGQGLLTRSDSEIQGFMDLDGKNVVVLEGTQAFHTLSRVQPNCRLIIVHSYDEGIEIVLKGDAEALCSDHILLMGLHYQHEKRTELRLLEQTFAPDSYAVGMKENESSLRDAVNRSIMKIWEEGSWQDAYETWFGQGTMYGHDLMFRIDVVPE